MRELTSQDIIEILVVTAAIIALWIINRAASRAEKNMEIVGESVAKRWSSLFGRLGGPPMVSRGPGPLILMGFFAYTGYLCWKLFESRAPFYVCATLGGLQLLPAVIAILQTVAPAAKHVRDGAAKLFGPRDPERNDTP